MKKMLKLIKAYPSVHHAEIIALLGRITFTETFGDQFVREELIDYLNKTFSTQKIFSSLQKDENYYLIAYYNELPVGYTKLKFNSSFNDNKNSNQTQLQKIYVLNEFTGHYVGKKMIEESMKIARDNKFDLMWLVVQDINYRAIKFYEKYSFVKDQKYHYTIGTKIFHYDLMVRYLNH